jgi:hypothetical protein
MSLIITNYIAKNININMLSGNSVALRAAQELKKAGASMAQRKQSLSVATRPFNMVVKELAISCRS